MSDITQVRIHRPLQARSPIVQESPMIPQSLVRPALSVPLLCGLLVGLAPADDRPAEDADKRFDAMLAVARKDPGKANWKELRHAFAETSRYKPYNAGWRDELAKVDEALKGGDTKAAEATLDTLLEREGFMRIDALALAASHYEETGQKAKAELPRKFVEGITGALFIPGAGRGFDKPIEILFIDEEYFVIESLKHKVVSQRLVPHDGHRFDVIDTEAGGEGGKMFYFNIDLPFGSLARMLEKPK